MAYLTEEELIERFEYYTIEIENRLIQEEDYKSVLNDIPFCAHVSHPKTFQLLYTNKSHTETGGFTQEEIRENWEEYVKIVHPATIQSLLQFLPGFYASEKKHNTISFMQYAKLFGSTGYQPVLTFSKVSTLPGDLKLWIYLLPEEFGKETKKLERVIRMDEFKLKHFKRFQQLTEREVEILKLLANGYNNPKIADKLFLSRSTIETHRKNLKRKLELKSLRDLMRYAFAFDLVEV